jgi:hypothetical protein
MDRELPATMIPPSKMRPTSHSGGTIQIMVTRACDLACRHCSQGSNLAGKPAMMTPGQFDLACRSLEGYWGVVGMFGGNPAIHPEFAELCAIMRATIPFRQRGLWSNNLLGKAAVARVTFNPMYSNLNVHANSDAADEIRRDWPEAAQYVRGEGLDSLHSSPWVSMIDMGIPEEERWKLIGECTVNRYWSALIGIFRGELRAWFCEIAGSQSMLHEKNPDWRGTGKPMPDTGLAVVPGWWKAPMPAYSGQVYEHCHSCGLAMNRRGHAALGDGTNEFSKTHEFIAKTKMKDHPVEIVDIGPSINRGERPAIAYLPGVMPGYNG